MNFINVNSSGKRSGFTLIELLVAVGITALLVSLMLNIVVNVTRGWSRSSGILTSGNQARLVLDQVSRDLQSAILKNDSNVWLAATIQTSGVGAGSLKPTSTAGTFDSTNTADSLMIPVLTSTTSPVPSLDDYRFGQAGVWLRFFTTVPDTNVKDTTTGNLHLSAPRAVSYQIVRQAVSAGSTEFRYLLFRSEIASDLTFTTGYNLYDANYYTGTSALLKSPTLDQVLANNVVDFGVRLWKHDSTGALVPIFPTSSTNLAIAATADTTKVGASPGESSSSLVRDFPEVADIFVRILTDDGVQKLDLLENPPAGYTPTDNWWTIVLANSRVYTRRIEIKSKAF